MFNFGRSVYVSGGDATLWHCIIWSHWCFMKMTAAGSLSSLSLSSSCVLDNEIVMYHADHWGWLGINIVFGAFWKMWLEFCYVLVNDCLLLVFWQNSVHGWAWLNWCSWRSRYVHIHDILGDVLIVFVVIFSLQCMWCDIFSMKNW